MVEDNKIMKNTFLLVKIELPGTRQRGGPEEGFIDIRESKSDREKAERWMGGDLL